MPSDLFCSYFLTKIIYMSFLVNLLFHIVDVRTHLIKAVK